MTGAIPSTRASRSRRLRRRGIGTSQGTSTAALNRLALAGALDPIITIDAFGIIRSASDSVQRVFGWGPHELLGQNVRILMPEPHRSQHSSHLARFRETGETSIIGQTHRFDAVRKDGTLFPVDVSITQAQTTGRSMPLFIGIIRDVSMQAAVEHSHEEFRAQLQRQVTEQTQALHAAHERLRMADRLASIGTLAAGLGHDINNVLLPVRARLNALDAAAASFSDCSREHVRALQESISYLQQLADGLHFLALDPVSEQAASDEVSTNLADWWSRTGPLLAKAVPKHVRVTASIPAELPPVTIAPHRLTQAVLNLIVNAGEAIPIARKRMQGRVRVTAHRSACDVFLRIADNGSGMSEEVRRRAFDMFFTTKARGVGTGLGLPLVHQVITSAGGTVQIDSEVGRGTTIILTLPIAMAANGHHLRDKPLRVAIDIRDGRAAGLVRHIIESAGHQPADRPDADVLILEPLASLAPHARRWLAQSRTRRVILFGSPAGHNSRWESLTDCILHDTSDLTPLRTCLARALESLAHPEAAHQ
ncbi:two-component system, NtrC family, sensor kinase [Phycisphaerales bacterium]|nr:two-component system, NtrC family, sensor kinase [Phycisphaerales bacterium]